MKRHLPGVFLCLAAAVLFILWQKAGPDREPAPQKRTSGAKQALDTWAFQRAYPEPGIPEIGFSQAFRQTRNMREKTLRIASENKVIDDTVSPWTLLGPTNVGGRTLALAIRPDHPDTMFAGSASGGLWKTVTGGVGADAWDYVDTGFPVLGVGAVTLDPSNPDVMYVGTGEVYRYREATGGDVDRTTRGSYGIGILKSTNGGATWSRSLDWSYQQTRGVWAIRVHPSDSSIVYAATTEGVYKSVDAGETWNRVLNVIMVTDLAIHPSDPEILLAACGNFNSTGRGIYKTTDGGGTWNKVTTGLPAAWSGKAMLAIAPSAPQVVYASIANTFAGLGLYKSFDTGDTWTRINSTDFQQWQGWYSHWVVVDPSHVNQLFVGGIDIWKSTDGGATLTKVSDWTQAFFGTPPPQGPAGGPKYAHADQHLAVWHPTDPSTVFSVSDGGVFKTVNLGDSYTSLNGGYVTSQFYQGFSTSPRDSNLAMGGMQDNFSAIYEGFPAWRRVIGGDGSWTAIDPGNDLTLYGSAQALNMQRSTDAGANWLGIAPSYGSDAVAFIAPFVVCPSNPNRLYAGTSRIYRSNNQGSAWYSTNGGLKLDPVGNPMFTLAVSATDADVAFAATAPEFARARVYRTLDGGTSWTEITGTLPDRYPSDLTVDSTDDSRVYITFLGFGTSHVYRSEDRGDTWINIGTDLPDIPASSIAVDPEYPNVLYVGTDLGVYVSPYLGVSWYPFMQGMPVAMVNDLAVSEPNRKLRAATHGNGVFERDLLEFAVTDIPGDRTPVTPAVGLQVLPNPLRTGGRILFSLEEAAPVKLDLYDVNGRRVKRLLDENRGPGPVELSFPREDLARGVYFLRLATPGQTEVSRVVFLR